MPITLLLFSYTSSLKTAAVFLSAYFNCFYVCTWTVVCNKEFIIYYY